MEQTFDKFGYPNPNYIILCNPNLEEIYSLGLAYNTKVTIRFNALSEISLTFPKSIDGGQTELEAYDYIQNKRVILLENYGYFLIVNSVEDSNGAVPIKNVSCQSLESEMISKRVTAYGGTRKLWDNLDPTNTILQDMINRIPNWSVGHVDTSLTLLFRTVSVSDTNVYNFLMNEVANAFECVFVFDTVTREINVYDLEHATTETDIFLSFDNTISKLSLSEKSDEVATCLSVYGGGALNIRNVNPLGTDKIYDFSYFQNTNWMSQGLVTAITNWETVVNTQQPIYANDLTLLQTYNSEMLDLQATLASLNSQYLTLEGVQAVRIQAGQPYGDINTALEAKQDEIDAQQTLINSKQSQIDTVTLQLQTINQLVSFDNNFTPEQLLELNNFIYENTYKNENIIQTDSMTLVEIQEASQALYDQAQNVLSRVSQPRYEFSIDSVNYTVIENFSIFTEQTEPGCVVYIELEDSSIIETVLLEISLQLDDPTNFSLKFSNRLRLDDGGFTYSDLMGQVVKTGSSVAFDSLKWSNWENDHKDEVTTFIVSALNTAVNNVVSNDNQDIVINQNGLRARQFNGTDYDGKQLWIVNNMLAFSDDGFQTAKLALGEIINPSGGSSFGLVAQTIVGNLIAGNELRISNPANNFVLDQTGATLNNAKFSIQTTNTKIIIDPTATNNFVIQKNEGGTFVNKFWVDNSGNVNFSGNLSGATGTFTGSLTATTGFIGNLVIDSNGLRTSDGTNYLRGNGDFKWGSLNMTGSTATFSGDIFANKIVGQIVNTQITNGAVTDGKISSGLNAGKVTFGNMSGSRILGGTPTVDSISSTGGSLVVNGSASIGGSLSISNNLATSGNISAGSMSMGTGSLTISSGNISVAGGTGLNTSRSITTPAGTRIITFSRGICVGFT